MEIEQLTQEEYSFYLAHGVTNDDELQLREMIDEYWYTETTQTTCEANS